MPANHIFIEVAFIVPNGNDTVLKIPPDGIRQLPAHAEIVFSPSPVKASGDIIFSFGMEHPRPGHSIFS